MNIIITSAGRRVSLVRAFQKELKQLVQNGKVFTADADPLASAACHVADGYVQVPLLDQPDYVDTLIKFCTLKNISLIVPTIDMELLVLARHAAQFEANNIKLVLSSKDFIQKCRNKRIIHEFFRVKGISTAREFSKDNFTLPLYIKPLDGSRSVDNYIITCKEELRDYHFKNDKLMFLEYLDHNEYEEFTCDLYYDKNNILKCAVPRKRIEVRDGEVNKGLTLRNELVPYIQNHLSEIKGARGCLTAQFFKHKTNNKIFGIEINPRFGGGFPLSYLAGANFPKWIIQEYLLDQKIEENFEVWESNLLMIRYDDEILVHGYKN
ncbi:ATP-grasp domain-containing protein [Arenibacter palladensis]|uniref:ATP-grasp domain-containing protein n=1 Tax=Arenibacter palladensis TaxID=237373 RepID=UPI002FCF14E2